MTLKYEIVSVNNKRYNPDKVKLLQSIISRLKGITNVVVDDERDPDELNPFDQTVREVNHLLRQYRQELKEYIDQPKFNKRLHVSSDKVWTFYNENYDEGTGVTHYGNKQEVRIDTTFNYDQKLNIKQLIEQIQNEAFESVRAYREEARKINTIQRQYVPKSMEGKMLPVIPNYEVTASGGYGIACKKTYKDAWREYPEITYDVPAVKSAHNIHMKGGTFLELKKSALVYRVFEPKAPTTKANHVGVEIEFISKFDQYRIAANLVKEDVQEFVHLHEDRSLRVEDGYPYRHEIAIVAPERMIGLVVEKTLRAINKDKASKVNWRCGLHVHIDIRNRDKNVVFHNFIKAQRIMFAMNPRSRLDGTTVNGKKDEVYSRRLDTTDFDQAVLDCIKYGDEMKGRKGNGIDYSRYAGVNPMSFTKHKTIEIRIHSGSTNLEKINNWITMLLAVANMETKIDTEYVKPENFCKKVGLDDKMLAYIKERIEKFKDKDGKHCTVDEVA